MDIKFIKKIEIDDKTKHLTNIDKKMYGKQTPYIQIKNMLGNTFNTLIPHATCTNIAYRLKTKCYAKTGSTDYDSYIVGFNEDILVGVWAGHLDNQKLTNTNTKKIPKEIFIDYINMI
jgi:membrane peptidoglycan carboxypeptidase